MKNKIAKINIFLISVCFFWIVCKVGNKSKKEEEKNTHKKNNPQKAMLKLQSHDKK